MESGRESSSTSMETVAETAAVLDMPEGIEPWEAGAGAETGCGEMASAGRATAGRGWADSDPATAKKPQAARRRRVVTFLGKSMSTKV
jgi:hypothetical protein